MKDKREILIDLYNQCTKAEKAFFNRMYKSVHLIEDEKIDHAILQCENTFKKESHKITKRQEQIDSIID